MLGHVGMNPRSVDRRLDMQIPGRMKETAVCAVSNQTNPATDGEINAAVSDQVSPVTDRCRGSQRYTSAQPHGEGAQAFPINPMKELSEEIAHMIYYEIERRLCHSNIQTLIICNRPNLFKPSTDVLLPR
jgi:hypothetical protein